MTASQQAAAANIQQVSQGGYGQCGNGGNNGWHEWQWGHGWGWQVHVIRTQTYASDSNPPPKGTCTSHGPIVPRWWHRQAHVHTATMVAHTQGTPLLQVEDTTPYFCRPGFPGGYPMSQARMLRRSTCGRPTSGRYAFHTTCRLHTQPLWWRMLMQAADCSHYGGACRVASPGITQSSSQYAVAPPGRGGSEGVLPVFRSRGLAGGRGRCSHYGGAPVRSHSGGATPWVIPPAPLAAQGHRRQ